MMTTLIQIGIGGAIGAILRYLVNISSTHLLGISFPYGTLFVNVVGSLLMGILVTYFMNNDQIAERFSPLIITGFLGGFTTFSAFSNDTWQLLNHSKIEWTLMYVFGSIILSFGALILGIFIVKA